VRQDVLKSLEVARKEKFIGAPLEAHVLLSVDGEVYPLLEQYATELPGLFIVSQVSLDEAAPGSDVAVKVERAAGVKCERCWKYTTDVGANAVFPTICDACANAVLDNDDADGIQ
jgi:isoleucyl-tRNA synthetase